MRSVIVIGGGLAGLATAFRLGGGVGVRVFEANGRAGGNLHTTASADGFRVEWGPNGFLDGKPGVLQLCRDLGLGGQLVAASDGSRLNRFVYWNGAVQKLPGGPVGLLTTPLLSLRGKLSLLAEPLRRAARDTPAESVRAFATRRMGAEAARVFVDALVTGIHAADPEKLSVRAAFPRLVEFERTSGSVLRGALRASKQKKRDAATRGEASPPQRMWSFPGGLQTLVDRLRDVLGDKLTLGAAARKLERLPDGRWRLTTDAGAHDADAVVLACPAHEQAKLLADIDMSLASDLGDITSTPVAVVALGYRAADAPTPDGFGYLAPQSLKRDALGVQWCSSIFPGRAPAGFVLWRALCGGAFRGDLLDLPDAELTRRIHAEMRATLKVTGEPVFTQVVKWPRAIPQYYLGHLERVERIDAAVARLPGLFVTGNAFKGVAMNDVAEQAALTAARVLTMPPP
jgi:oxygen-dependent protoporphyrinogen oxidase